MSSGGWEKVGGKTNKVSKSGKFTKTEKKVFAEKAPKLEDVLSPDQITGAYDLLTSESDRDLSKSPKKDKKKEASNNNNVQKAQKNGKKPTTESKETAKKPKNLEEAAKQIKNPDLQELLANTKAFYPQNQILWIKDAASYFNTVLMEIPISFGDAFSPRPLSVLTKETKRILASLFQDCNDAGRESAFGNILANLAHDMAKGVNSNGNAILLQQMAEIYPSLCTTAIGRANELLKSYKNKTNIGTALMWAIGQGGRKDLAVGIKVWIETISEQLTLKHYTKFVVDYLTGLFKCHESKVLHPDGKKRYISNDQYFKMLNIIFIQGSGLNKESSSGLLDEYVTIKNLSIGNCSGDHELFPHFLRLLRDAMESDKTKQYRKELLKNMTESLANNRGALGHWHQMYATFLPASVEFLQHLDQEWTRLPLKQRSDKALRETFEAFQEHNNIAMTKKHGPEVNEAHSVLESLLSKMSRNQQRRGWFSWRLRSWLLLGLISYLIYQDIQQHKGFEKSKTGIFLKDIGLDQYALSSFNYASNKVYSAQAWVDTNFPVVRENVLLAKEKAQPYVKQGSKLINDGTDWAVKQWHFGVDKVNESFPGFREKLIVAWEGFKEAFGVATKYAIEFAKVALIYVVKGAEYLFAKASEGFKALTDGTIKWDEIAANIKKNAMWVVDEIVKLYHKIVQQVQTWLK